MRRMRVLLGHVHGVVWHIDSINHLRRWYHSLGLPSLMMDDSWDLLRGIRDGLVSIERLESDGFFNGKWLMLVISGNGLDLWLFNINISQ
jgi:hypothetical protein